MDGRIVSGDVEFWTRARRHLLKYGGEFVDFVPVRAEGAFLYDEAGRRVLDSSPVNHRQEESRNSGGSQAASRSTTCWMALSARW